MRPMINDQNPVDSIQRLAVRDCPRTRHYSRLIDEGLEAMLAASEAAPADDPDKESCSLDRLPFGAAANATVRQATSFTGYLAFCWANPWSRYHHDPRLLAQVKARLLGFADLQQSSGAIVLRTRHMFSDLAFEPALDKPIRESHGNSWYIEPLMLAAWWVESELTPDERARVHAMIRRAADLHAAIPVDEMNNRGVIRNAILCMSGHFLKDPNLIRIGIADFHKEPVRVFNEKDGQINEGTGPDANYSGTSFIYAYLYRLFSGDVGIDRKMVDALRWATWVFDPNGHITLFGASTRVPLCGGKKIADFLPALERYADVHPQFSWLIDNGYLGEKKLGGCFHSVSPLIWALLEHNGQTPVEDPAWFENRSLKAYNPKAGPEFMYTNEGYAALYFMFRGDYHASTTFIGRSPYKGFQHWSYRREPPVIWPTESHASRTRAWGIDTSHFNASGVKFRDKIWREGPPHLLVARFENIWHHYVLTRTTVLLLISSPPEPREDLWVIDKARCGRPVLGSGVLTYPGRQGRLHFDQANPVLRELPNGWHLVFAGAARTRLYAFSNDSFRLLSFDPAGDRLQFADDTGAYELEYELRFYADDAIRSIGYEANNDTGKVKTRVTSLSKPGAASP
jgi:hypothetical protein